MSGTVKIPRGRRGVPPWQSPTVRATRSRIRLGRRAQRR